MARVDQLRSFGDLVADFAALAAAGLGSFMASRQKSSEYHRSEGSNGMAKADREFPSLTTERLRLRAPRMEDAESFRALLSIPQVTHYSNWTDAPKPPYGERAMRWMAKLHAGKIGCAWVIEGPNGAARLLGLQPSTLRSRLKKLGLQQRPS
jgi:hypothetical protein